MDVALASARRARRRRPRCRRPPSARSRSRRRRTPRARSAGRPASRARGPSPPGRPGAAPASPSIPLLPGMTTSISTTSGLCSIASKTARSPSAPRRPSRCRPPRRARAAGPSARPRDRRRRGRGCSRRAGPRRRSVVPEPGADSTWSRPPRSATRSRMPTRPSASSRLALASKPRPSSSTTATTGSVFALQQDADVRRSACLTTFVSASWTTGRGPSRPRGQACSSPSCDSRSTLQAASARGSCPPGARRAGTSPKSSSADGRSSTASRRTSWSVETTSSRTDCDRRAPPSESARLLERLQPEQDRRERLAGLVVQLAGEPVPLELLRLDDAADGVAADALATDRPRWRRGPRATPRGAGRRREARVGALLVVGDHDTDRAARARAAAR